MLVHPPFHLLILIGGTTAALSPLPVRSEGVEWGPCSDVFLSPMPIECGNLTVPLDYANSSSSETINLELLKVKALNGPSKGSILFNFGGPGVGTRISLAERANLLQAVTGGNHDLISWDPRGTVNTTTFKCGTGAFEGYEYIPGTPGNSSDRRATGHQWASATAWANTCYLNPESRETGSRIGTAYTVRDSDEFLPVVDRVVGSSRSIGHYGVAVQMLCAQWRIEARETYKGDFKVNTKNPLLIFSNTLDPATPLRSALNVSETFEGSVFLQSEGLGHGWRTHPSLCVAKAFQKYFDESVLPEPGTKCKTDFAAFDVTNTSWDELLPQLGFEPVTRRSNQLYD
ncbi:uncharacterized protein GLRG_10052 [Colletotrichum graminicola M1.001]|uniref:Peptidase S33 tripeptidyl aminopeptidase-like C-terminal domain-containing protein n=1 Tax=Colletotrichum graminicola (strain M1.001 / M2 / FGSC 10212) TaxID=645133 RepID=E3QVM0_COLGM|nr:uncharacterized protein GLRG_10052 [Colletotrichum graminicola M1.001]EFQ34908.1 hypothetical protein GLRG_10052 [Colletotrichum graminicola M1.001]